MACKLIWSPAARDDLPDIVRFIARDNPQRGIAAAVRLMSKYADVPMDFPDATLVWIAEQTGTDNVLTLDRRGFSSFRFGKNRRFKLLLDS